jgi:tetratricopeptide (TPR) repeat protein
MFAGRDEANLDLLDEAQEIFESCLVSARNQDLRRKIYNDLGLTCYHTAQLDDDTNRLERALKYFEQVRADVDATKDPVWWLRIHQNLGQVFRALGEKTDSMEYLEKSILSLREAEKLAPKETAPMAWATIEFFLAQTHFQIAKRQIDTGHLAEAHTACAETLSVLGVHHHGTFPEDARKLADAIERLWRAREEAISA